MISEQSIPCPVCQTKIPFDAVALVKGHKFSCHGCLAVVGIAQEAIETASEAINTYQELKKQSLGTKNKLKN